MDVLEWLREVCGEFVFDVVAVYRRAGAHAWPLVGDDPDDLERQPVARRRSSFGVEPRLHPASRRCSSRTYAWYARSSRLARQAQIAPQHSNDLGDGPLAAGGHLLPLPKEPAALANVLEVAIVDFVLDRVSEVPGVEARRGTERGYPDIIELSGEVFGGGYHAVDVKVARLSKSGTATQSRVTLYTGNTYFRYPQLQWPGTFRPFRDYASHLDIVAVYRFTPDERRRLADLELIAQETWRIASRQRSSTTREYIGGVQSLQGLREGAGEFSSEEEFYRFWRRYPFRVGTAVQRQLDRLLATQDEGGGGRER